MNARPPARPDTAPGETASQEEARGKMKVRFQPCGCVGTPVYRVRRKLWMRVLFPRQTLYHCMGCNERFLTSWNHLVLQRPIMR